MSSGADQKNLIIVLDFLSSTGSKISGNPIVKLKTRTDQTRSNKQQNTLQLKLEN